MRLVPNAVIPALQAWISTSRVTHYALRTQNYGQVPRQALPSRMTPTRDDGKLAGNFYMPLSVFFVPHLLQEGCLLGRSKARPVGLHSWLHRKHPPMTAAFAADRLNWVRPCKSENG